MLTDPVRVSNLVLPPRVPPAAGDYQLGELAGYPDPIVDLKQTRDRALEAFSQVSGLPRAIRPPASLVE